MGHRRGPLLACFVSLGLFALAAAARPGVVAKDNVVIQTEAVNGAQRELSWFGFNKKALVGGPEAIAEELHQQARDKLVTVRPSRDIQAHLLRLAH